MKANIGIEERVIRVIVGLAIMALAIYYESVWFFLGLEIALTGIVGWSPVYRLFDISTSRLKTHHRFIG